jgi:two-component system sensor histidine kinase MtrB
VIGVISHGLPGSQDVALPAAFSRGPFDAIAASPASAGPATMAGCRGKNVYITSPQRDASVTMQTLPAACTALSWDGLGNLWTATKTGPLVLPSAGFGAARQILPVSAPPALLPPAGVVTSVRVAPDGVRVAMIVRTRARVQVLVAAISEHAGADYLAQSTQTVTVGSDIKGTPVAASWWDADHLLVLARSAGAVAQLYEVPLNGGVSSPLVTPANAVSLAVSGTDVLIGTAGRGGVSQAGIWRSAGLNGPWRLVTEGIDPVAPG